MTPSVAPRDPKQSRVGRSPASHLAQKADENLRKPPEEVKAVEEARTSGETTSKDATDGTAMAMEAARPDEAAAAATATVPAKTGEKTKEGNDEAEEAKSAALPDEADTGDEDSEEDDVSVLTDGGAEADDGTYRASPPGDG